MNTLASPLFFWKKSTRVFSSPKIRKQKSRDKKAPSINPAVDFHVGDLPGVSVFGKNTQGQVYHTYSTYARGVDMLNGAYQYIDLTAKGRDEDFSSDFPSGWVRYHDKYPKP